MISTRIFHGELVNTCVWQYLLLVGLLLFSHNNWAKEGIQIGMLVDGRGDQQQVFIGKLRQELSSLLGSKYQIGIPEGKILFSNWSASQSINNYSLLTKDRDVDIIIVAGVISSAAVLHQKRYDKPVIAIGVADQLQINLTKQSTSGVSNLSYILFNRSITNDLGEFYRLFPYRRVAIVASKDLLELVLDKEKLNDQSPLTALMSRNKTEFVTIPVDRSITGVINNLQNVDAVYLSYLGRLEGKDKIRLIKRLNARKIPSFGSSVADVEHGILAAIAPKQPFDKLVRRLALNIEAILSGKNASTLPAHISFEEYLTINMETAQEIDLSPPFSLLSEAVLVNEFADTTGGLLTLKQAIQAALDSNLALALQVDKVKGSQLNVELAQSSNYPSLSFNATGTRIDEDRAEASFGQQAETTTSGTLKLQQLIFSEGQSGNVDIQQYLLDASQYSLEQQKLDVILDAATAYFTVLKAKTGRSIQQENVKITRQNLTIAKQREAVGFSGRSDVYFWESQLATATTDHLSAFNQYKLSQIQLNQILNYSLSDKFTLQEISLTRGVYANYLKGTIRTYVDSPSALEKFTAFLVDEAMKNSPEILQINASINAQKRRLTSNRKKHYLPDVNLVAETQHMFTRSGAGSAVSGVDPDDDTWSASVNFSWPLYEGGSISVEGKQAANEIMQLKDQRLQTHQSLEFKVRAALLDLVTQAVNLKSSRRSAEFAGKSLALVQDAYSQGKASVAELSDAQKTAVIADQKALNSIYDYLLTVLKMERAVGKFFLLSNVQEQAAYLNRLEQYFN